MKPGDIVSFAIPAKPGSPFGAGRRWGLVRSVNKRQQTARVTLFNGETVIKNWHELRMNNDTRNSAA